MTESYLQIAANNEELARDIVERASARGVTVSTAESLTAGMIASTIADIPGASAVLRGGAVTYCDEIKHRVLGVERETLDRFSAVSHQTAREMAAGSLDLYPRWYVLYWLGVSRGRWGSAGCRVCALSLRGRSVVRSRLCGRGGFGAHCPRAQFYGIDVV